MKLEEPSDGGRARFLNSIPASGWQPFRSFRDFAARAPAKPQTFVFNTANPNLSAVTDPTLSNRGRPESLGKQS